MDTAKERGHQIELYFHRSEKSESSLTSSSSSKYNLKFHTYEVTKEQTDIVLQRIWESQLLRGCAFNQIWHPLDETCVQFCQPRGVAGSVKKHLLGYGCTITLQDRIGDSICQKDFAVPPAKCKKLCDALFPMHPSCSFSDPSLLPKIRDDFLKLAQVSTKWTKLKFGLWDTPRALTPAAVLIFRSSPILGPLVSQQTALGESIARLLGYYGTLEGTGYTALGIASATSGSVLSLVYAGMEVYDLINTIKQFRKEDMYMKKAMEEKLKLFEHSKCRVINSMTYNTMSNMIPDENGRTQADHVTDTVRYVLQDVLERPTSTEDLNFLLDSICNYGNTGKYDEEVQLPAGLSTIECKNMVQTVRREANRASDTTKQSRSTNMMKQITLSILEANDVDLEEMQAWCAAAFPPSSESIEETKPPITNLYIGYLTRKSKPQIEDWRQWLNEQGELTYTNYEAIERYKLPKTNSKVDMKMGVGGYLLDTILLAARTGGGLPITRIEIQQLPTSPSWSTLASETAPSKFEYEHQVKSASESTHPVSLLPTLRKMSSSENVLEGDETTETNVCKTNDEQCTKFAKKFKGARFLDTVRSGG